MKLMHGWCTTLTEAGLLDRTVVLRPMRAADLRTRVATRQANDSWLRRWDASSPDDPAPPAPAAGQVRRTLVEPYISALYLRLCALLGLAANWAIWYDGQFAGQLTVFRIAWGPLRSAEVGYWIDQRLAGRGIAPTALALAVDHCFGAMRLHRIEACIQPENTASRRTVEKLGFREEGLRERQVHINGAWRDHLCYAITDDEVPFGLLARWRKAVASRPPAVASRPPAAASG
jgi:ribosomal-protein-alanine N-acetyltransferase